MSHRYLNDLKFDFKLPYNPEADIEGVWWFDCVTHPHEQWRSVSIQSNFRWFTAWGIQQLLIQWREKTTELYDADDFDGKDDLLFDMLFTTAEESETINDYRAYRHCLDEMILHTRADLDRFVRQQELDMHGDVQQARDHTAFFINRFDFAFS